MRDARGRRATEHGHAVVRGLARDRLARSVEHAARLCGGISVGRYQPDSELDDRAGCAGGGDDRLRSRAGSDGRSAGDGAGDREGAQPGRGDGGLQQRRPLRGGGVSRADGAGARHDRAVDDGGRTVGRADARGAGDGGAESDEHRRASERGGAVHLRRLDVVGGGQQDPAGAAAGRGPAAGAGWRRPTGRR